MYKKRASFLKIIFVLSFISAILSLSNQTSAATTVSSNIASDTTWSEAGSPYTVTSSISVNAGVTLTIEPGVTVQFYQYTGLNVPGTILASGTEDKPINFTATGGNPSKGWWAGINITGSGSGTFSYCVISYGGYSLSADISKTGNGSLSLSNTTLSQSSNNGLSISANSGALSAASCTFSNNYNGVWLDLNMSSNFIDDTCVFSANTNDVAIRNGTMTSNAVWDLKNAYSMFLTGDLTVASGATLTIAPGTVIKAAQYSGIYIKGAILARGEADAAIYFTHHGDDSVGGDANNDNPESSPAPNWWHGIQISEGGSGILEYCSIRYGGYSGSSDIAKSGTGSLQLNHCTFSHSGNNGLSISANSGILSAASCTFSNNTNGVWIDINMSSDFIDDTCIFSANTNDLAIQNGNMTSNAIWDLKSAYSMYLVGNLTVAKGATLTISKGTVIKSSQYNGLFIQGVILAQGTADAPIYFTHHADDTVGGDANNDNPETSPGPNWWQGIKIYDQGSGIFEYCTVRYAGYSSTANLSKAGSGQLTLNHCTFSYSNNGLSISANSGNLSATYCTFSNNNKGVWFDVNMSSDFIGDSCIFSNNVNDAAIQNGTLTANTTWDLKSDYSMFLIGNVTVANGATLTIAPGTVIKSSQYNGLFIQGVILAQGTADAPIYFTHHADDTVGGDANNDNPETSPGPNWWQGIKIYDQGSGIFEHCSIRYAGYSWTSNLTKTGTGQLTLSNCTFSYSSNNGLSITGNSGPLAASACTFSNNNNGIGIDINMSTDFIDNSCVFNGNINDVAIQAGTITKDTTWDLKSDYSMFLTGNVTVANGTTLTISPGTVIKSSQYNGIFVQGAILAKGTADAPIYFTHHADDTVGGDANNDNPENSPSPNWWQGIKIYDQGSGTFEYCSVRYAGYSWTSDLTKMGTGQLTLKHSTFSHSSNNGLSITANSGALAASACTFSYNNNGIWIDINMSSDFIDNACVFNNNINDVNIQSGTMSADAIWKLNSGYSMYLNGNLTVAAGATLTIAPGTVMKSSQYNGIFVKGTLLARGTANAPICFTHHRDDTVGGDSNNDNPESPPGPNWWQGIRITDEGSGTFEHCTIRYGGYSNNNLYKSGSGALLLDHAVVSYSSGNGLCIENNSTMPVIKNSFFTNNQYGLRFYAPVAGIVLSNCNIEKNSSYGVFNNGPNDVNAEKTWWGDASGPIHSTLNPNGSGNRVSDYVIFKPWRTTSALSRIISPIRSGAIVAGDSLRFIGKDAEDPNQSYLWNFGDGRTSSLLTPGLVAFNSLGDIDVNFYLVDSQGSPDSNPDTRQFTVTANTGEAPDLKATSFNVPINLSIGQPATVNYSVKNIGNSAIPSSSWKDSLYFSKDQYLDADDQLLATIDKTASLAVNEEYNGSFQINIPSLKEGQSYLLLSVDDDWAILEQHQLNNELAAATDLSVPLLESGTGQSAIFTNTVRSQLFRVEVPEGKSVHIVLDGADNLGVNELYMRYGGWPGFGQYDYKSTVLGKSDQEIIIPVAFPGTWYVLVYGSSIQGNGEYTILADVTDLSLTDVSPDKHSRDAETVLTLAGAGFAVGTTVELVASNGSKYSAGSIEIDSSTRITAVFDPFAVPAGIYTVRVTRPGMGSAELSDAFEMLAGGQGILKTNLVIPNSVGYHQLATLYIEYQNTGNAAMPAPLLILTAIQNGQQKALMTLDQNRITEGFWTSAVPEGFGNSVQLLACGENAGVLNPGESRRVPVYYAGWLLPWDFSYPPIEFKLGVIRADSNESLDISPIKDELKPVKCDDDGWSALWSNLTEAIGGTYGGYVSMLDSNSAYLDRQGKRVVDVGKLLAFEIRKAEGLNPLQWQEFTIDAAAHGSMLPLVFSRIYRQGILSRFRSGPLGRGWSHQWEMNLEKASDGTITIYHMDEPFTFQPDSRGGYFSPPGLNAKLTGGGDAFTLSLAGGLSYYFSGGALYRIEDLNSNNISLTYASGRISAINCSSGESLTISYNASGLIQSIRDQNNRTATYSYDPVNEHLASVSLYNGLTVNYAYNQQSGSPNDHALVSVTYADGSKREFGYDSKGRLAEIHLNDNHDRVVFTYDSNGTVTASNAAGNSRKYYFDNNGFLSRTEGPQKSNFFYDISDNGNLRKIIGPDGHFFQMDHDGKGNLIRIIDPLGNRKNFNYNSLGKTTQFLDEAGNMSSFEYDSKGNVSKIAYADKTFETYTYDQRGRTTGHRNGRGQTTSYLSDEQGRISAVEYPDGAAFEYEYNAAGEILTANDPSGRTSITYDGEGRISRIDYPGARFLAYTYDSGRRASMSDHLGNITRYKYDKIGRLEELVDKDNNLIVRYAYDVVGNLNRKTLGNGVYTDYLYNEDGNPTAIINHRPDVSEISRFEYTYNVNGDCETMHSAEGTWTYAYNALGRITHAVFASADQNIIPDQDIVYTYDAAGNRKKAIINGAETLYEVNAMNQCLAAGDANFSFDADGNMISGINGADSWSYTYDAANRLTKITHGNDVWTYTYNAFGFRTAMDKNGVITYFVTDPSNYGDIVAEYDEAGNLVNKYEHGYGLISLQPAGSSRAYYTFDAAGNATGITGNSGAVLNKYFYKPFGERLLSNEALSNHFTYNGEHGVFSEVNGIYFMRNRYYSSYLGRFLSKDPPRDSHENRYNYALNNPITFIDPLGTETVIIWNDIQTRQHVKDLIEYERKHGTSAAISDFEPTWFGENSYKMKNVHVMTNQGMVDLDWFFCICHKSSGVTAVNTGVVGAWIGSHVLPGWGTAIGGAGGAIVGMLTPQAKLAYYEMKFGWSLADSNNRWAHLKAIGNDEEQIAIKMAQRIMEGASIETVFAEFGIPTGAKDPNQKTGPKGFGNACYIKPDGLFVYRVDFENDKSASAPAQVVTITDQLHTNLDWSTFELTEVGFGDHLIQIPPNTQHFEHKEPMRYNDRDIEVQIDIGIDQNTGIITAWVTTIDPLTGLPPDVSTGFLPPEDGTGRGQGHFSYIVKADENLATGSEIRNIASITFDFGETIATNQVDPHDPDQGTDPGKEVPNTIDSDSPTSSVQPLPASSPLVFDVQWAGADGNGSGPSSYSVYMQDNSADFKLWLSDTTQAAAKFRGKSGHTYGFFSIAKDNVGNYEAIKNEPEAETTVLLVEGDVNGDGKADLTDVILILKIISGIEMTDPVYTDYDINSDGRIGIEEAINALHEISGIR